MDSAQVWTITFVCITFALYIGVAIWAKAKDTKSFFVAGGQVSPLANGMATAADWMSAASFISMAGLIAMNGRDGSVYLMGWTGGFVLLALLLAPYLRKFGKFTVPDFLGDRYYSKAARLIGVVCAVLISFTYVAGQMRGVGLVFSRFLGMSIEGGVVLGMGIVLFYAVLGGMKGITYTQVVQFCVLIFAFTLPAVFLSFMFTGKVAPQIGLGSQLESGGYLLEKLDLLCRDLGFNEYTSGQKGTFDVFCITAALMLGTAGLPHVIVRFFTVPRIKDARMSAGYALIFIAILYTTAPAIAAFARYNLMDTVANKPYQEMPNWFNKWEDSGLIAWVDKNNDGLIDYTAKAPFIGKPKFDMVNGVSERGQYGQRLLVNIPTKDTRNELYVDKDIMVLANPEIANLPDWVIAIVAAGGLAAALSTAAGLLLVISTSIAHDLVKKSINPKLSDKKELRLARIASGGAVIVAGYFGINPPGFVAEVVALAFGLAASSFFPAIILGIFSKRVNKEGVLAGMITGVVFTLAYVIFFKSHPEINNTDYWLWEISPEGIGTLGMILNIGVTLLVSYLTPAPPQSVRELVEKIRVPVN